MNGGTTPMVEQRTDRSRQALGPYQLTRLLGAGGFGEVYEAVHFGMKWADSEQF
jgi:serine/threonine protein kinase